jgi:hypothetical protein
LTMPSDTLLSKIWVWATNRKKFYLINIRSVKKLRLRESLSRRFLSCSRRGQHQELRRVEILTLSCISLSLLGINLNYPNILWRMALSLVIKFKKIHRFYSGRSRWEIIYLQILGKNQVDLFKWLNSNLKSQMLQQRENCQDKVPNKVNFQEIASSLSLGSVISLSSLVIAWDQVREPIRSQFNEEPKNFVEAVRWLRSASARFKTNEPLKSKHSGL